MIVPFFPALKYSYDNKHGREKLIITFEIIGSFPP